MIVTDVLMGQRLREVYICGTVKDSGTFGHS